MASAAKCHNCRRRRLRCDRSVPSCHKCSINGEECLGYGPLLRWADAPAIRGKLAGQGLEKAAAKSVVTAARLSVITPLDPLVSGLDKTSRYYVHHCMSFFFPSPRRIEVVYLTCVTHKTVATTVCRDLVSIDQDSQNPFRIMLPLINRFDYLQAIVIATSAMHLATLHRIRGRPSTGTELVDALSAKGLAIRLLRNAVDSVTPSNRAPLLAAIVFFVNLDLIDSGKGGWKAHVQAARSLISSIYQPDSAKQIDTTLAPLADAIAADCLTYQILGSTISIVDSVLVNDDSAAMTVLHRAQPYSYHCCPPPILQTILSASQLHSSPPTPARTATTAHLLAQARSFDVPAWVSTISGLSPHDDRAARVQLASAHRAAACLYILLSGAESPPRENLHVREQFVGEILRHLSRIPGDHVLLKGTVWPTFMAGAQTDDPAWRAWCMERLRKVWTRNPWVCPWGYVITATEMMQRIWDVRDGEGEGGLNWLRRLKESPEDLLIV